MLALLALPLRAFAMPSPIVARPGDPPRIVAVHFSTMTIRVGSWWSGRVVTTTNVASLELRAPSFSFILHRTAYGEFSFRTHVLVVPTVYRRPFVGELVARTASGASVTRTYRMAFV